MQDPSDRAETAPPRVLLISLSGLPDDPRVRRMGDYLHAQGWVVVGVGLPGSKNPPPPWTIVEALREPDGSYPPVALEPPTPVFPDRSSGKLSRAIGAHFRGAVDWSMRKAPQASRLAFGNFIRLRSRFLPQGSPARKIAAEWATAALDPATGPNWIKEHWAQRKRAHVSGETAEREMLARYGTLQDLNRAVRAQRGADLVIANDWLVLPMAAAVASEMNVPFVYDSHEFAAEEYAEKFDWRVMFRPLVKTIEREHIGGAALITSVSPGITEVLVRTYNPTVPALTLRNLPSYTASPFRPCSDQVRVLYHGIIAPGRGLEATIESLPDWPAGFDFTIRGPQNPAYMDSLRALAEARGVSDRLHFAPAVPMKALVEAAQPYDIGMMALPGHSQHNAFALPNKIFEYLMAGLVLCVSDLPEMARVVRDTKAGVLCGDGSSAQITRTMLSLDRAQINAMKKNALEAANKLHFDADAAPVLAHYREIVERSRAQRALRN